MTNRIDLPYGHGALAVELPDAEYETLMPARPPAGQPTARVAATALENPIGTPRLRDFVHAGEQIAIAIPDITRPCPTADLLPPLLAELACAGVRERDMLLVSGLGSHRAQTDAERAELVGADVYRRIRCVDGDRNEVTRVGVTSRGTPVEVYTPLVQADRRIGVGVLEYHYFAGFSGGYKAIVPGCGSTAMVTANHSHMVESGAETGRIKGNPVRADLEEAGAMVGLDFILNVILDEEHNAVAAVAGDPIAAHRAGCKQVDALGRAELPWCADIVLVSGGGYPKDINVYQAQKALDNARLAVRPGGTIIWVAECPEGLGHGVFAEWMLSGQTPEQMIERIRNKFVLGGHKAAAIAMARKQARVVMVSALPPEQVKQMGFMPYASPTEALKDALAATGGRARVAIMPLGGSVLPAVARPAISAADFRKI